MEAPLMLASIFDELDPPIRKRKISNAEVLNLVCFALKTGVPWRYIPVKAMCGWSAAYKRYQRWVQLSLFDKALTRLRDMYSERKLASDPKWFKELFIDCSFVKNVGGVDGLGKNPTDRGRMATKMSAIVDNDKMPLSCEFFPGNINDCKTALQTVDAITCPLRINKRYKNIIVGDKGYVSKQLTAGMKLRGKSLLTPRKINMVKEKKHTKEQKRTLMRRHKVENFFIRLDKFKKIHCRHEKNLSSFKSLTLFAMALLFANNPILSSVGGPSKS
jgi:putative transposase